MTRPIDRRIMLMNGGGVNYFSQWKSRRNLASSQIVNVVVVGNSITYGYYATNMDTQGYVGVIRTALQTAYGDAGWGLYTPDRLEWTFAGTWAASTAGILARGKMSNTPGSTATITVTGDSIDVYFVSGGGISAFNVIVDGGAPVSCSGTGSNIEHSQHIDMGSLGSHTVEIDAPASGWIYFSGIRVNKGTTGIQVHNLGFSGAQMAAIHPEYTTALQFFGLLSPALTILAMDVNDFRGQVTILGTNFYQSRVNQVIAKARLYGSALVLGEDNDQDQAGLAIPQSQYRSIGQGVANSNGAKYYDISQRWGSWSVANGNGLMYDYVHPTDAGHADMAAAILGLIA